MTFKEKVYEFAKKIPIGKVATYGQLAALAGNHKAGRAVGTFMKTNPYAPAVPCHRVVGSNGELTGYTGGKGIITKKKMLKNEGVVFKKDKVDLSRSLWKPN
ncbi:hypothetical protein A2V49_01855 [candidate division WWE3 bacterium RBG_19FT_COMBO_34_6]|uniref:methylated-DNA--[protein]-cysteine S-methyltransferase n=1 Tax=candidate division WWE3 bacterium RBG_19FT_COMBO_34_6 TaxID=1802612 RepID=A0A1F4UKM4_UNCKA|nr:MAG: hypothetical protein A2V49_01855 [candidate division WWE3 bacterium RBG_19FT_COMBO_34_6]